MENLKNYSNLLSKIGFDDARYYLAALIDGEGSVECRLPQRRVTIYNTEEDIIDAAIECLNILDIDYSIYEYKTGTYKNVTNIRISRRANLERLYELVPIMSQRKRELLYKCIITYKHNLGGVRGIDFHKGKWRA